MAKDSSLKLLLEYKDLFCGIRGKYTGSDYSIKLQKNANISCSTFSAVNIAVLKKTNNSQWTTSTFIISKKNGTFKLSFDLLELNKKIDRNYIQFLKY